MPKHLMIGAFTMTGGLRTANGKQPWYKKNGAKIIMGFIIAIAGAAGKWVWDEYIKPKPLYVNIAVFADGNPPKALKDVAVWLKLDDVEPKKTGDFGRVRIQVPRKYRGDEVTPQFDLDGYSRISGPKPDKIVLADSETSAVFVLTKNAVAYATPTPTPTPTPVTHGAGQFERRAYSSGALASGASDAFSQWYQLCSDPEPEGWTIAEQSFVLTGDRQCAAWSECKQTENSATRACWQFRMQGHSEQANGLFGHGNTGIQFSTGVLNVLWKH